LLSGIRRPSLCPSISSRGFRCERAHGGIRIADLAFHEKPDLRTAVRQAVQRIVPAGVRQLPTPATSQRRRRLQLPVVAASWVLHCTQFCQAISMTFRSAYTFGSLCLPFGILRGLRQKSPPAPKPVASKLFFFIFWTFNSTVKFLSQYDSILAPTILACQDLAQPHCVCEIVFTLVNNTIQYL